MAQQQHAQQLCILTLRESPTYQTKGGTSMRSHLRSSSKDEGWTGKLTTRHASQTILGQCNQWASRRDACSSGKTMRGNGSRLYATACRPMALSSCEISAGVQRSALQRPKRAASSPPPHPKPRWNPFCGLTRRDGDTQLHHNHAFTRPPSSPT